MFGIVMCGEPGTGTSSKPLCGARVNFRAGGKLGSGMLLMLLLRGIAGRYFQRSGNTVAPPNARAALLLVGQPGLPALLVRAPEADHRALPP